MHWVLSGWGGGGGGDEKCSLTVSSTPSAFKTLKINITLFVCWVFCLYLFSCVYQLTVQARCPGHTRQLSGMYN